MYRAEVKLKAQTLKRKSASSPEDAAIPSALDWLSSNAIRSYEEIGKSADSGQVIPLMLTRTLAELAQGKGLRIVMDQPRD